MFTTLHETESCQVDSLTSARTAAAGIGMPVVADDGNRGNIVKTQSDRLADVM